MMEVKVDVKSSRWKRRPEGSNWGEFGDDDQLGSVGRITPKKVLEGVAEVREGRTFCLSMPLHYPISSLVVARKPPRLRPVEMNGVSRVNFQFNADKPDIYSDDCVELDLQYSTQWDGLAHAGLLFDVEANGEPLPVYYNGYRAKIDVLGPSEMAGERDQSRAKKLGIEHFAVHGMQGRGVMIDLRAHLGDVRTRVSFDILQRILEADRVVVEPGDMVCFHTGFADIIMEADGRPDVEKLKRSCAVIDGSDKRLLDWITKTQISAIIADNFAVESLPKKSERDDGHCHGSTMPLHEHCLFKNGIPLAELWHLTPLANWLRQHQRFRFLLTAPPLRLEGAMGSPVTPVATV